MNKPYTPILKQSAILFTCTLLVSCSGNNNQIPEIHLTNGILHAKIYPPDPVNGYYQGTRFDWAGVVASLEFDGHSFFGQWFENYDPKIHDAILGPVEAFDPIGYEEANPGETFLKIGIGSLIKLDDNAYRFTSPYQVDDYGDWEVKKEKDQVEFIHQLSDAAGYSYIYRKTLALIEGKPELELSHSLKNTGNKKIETRVYNHNFFMLDSMPIGPAYSVTFPFELTVLGNSRGSGSLTEIKGNRINYLRQLEPGESVHYYLEGFGKSPSDYDIRIENSQSGAGVRIRSDQPISDLAFWSIKTTLCPEPYTTIAVDPGKEIQWSINYSFYKKD